MYDQIELSDQTKFIAVSKKAETANRLFITSAVHKILKQNGYRTDLAFGLQTKDGENSINSTYGVRLDSYAFFSLTPTGQTLPLKVRRFVSIFVECEGTHFTEIAENVVNDLVQAFNTIRKKPLSQFNHIVHTEAQAQYRGYAEIVLIVDTTFKLKIFRH